MVVKVVAENVGEVVIVERDTEFERWERRLWVK